MKPHGFSTDCRPANFLRLRHVVASCLLATSVLLLGGCCLCASSAYDTQAYVTWKELEEGLHENATPVDADQTGVSIRMPRLFATAGQNKAEAFRPDQIIGEDPMNRLHVFPPQVELPGLRFTYEMYAPTAAGKDLPVYSYLAVLPPGDAERDAALAQIQTAVSEQTGAPATWESIDLEGLEPRPARFMSVTGMQEFPGKGSKFNIKGEETVGRLDLYLVSTSHANVLIGWRAPDELAKKFSFFKAAKVAMGTLQSEKVAPPAAAPPEGEAAPAGDMPPAADAPPAS